MPDPASPIPPDRVPVLIGIGEVNDRPDPPSDGMSSPELMCAALRQADLDAGGGWLGRLDSLDIVNQISWPVESIETELPRLVGIAPRHVATGIPTGDGPVRYLNDAANRIARGDAEIAAIVGGEALRTAAARRAGWAAHPSKEMMRARAETMASPLRRQYGLLTPTDVYPLYEAGTRAAWAMSLAAAQAETAAIWSRFSEIAAGNPQAWIRRPYGPDEILAEGPGNRPIAHPYSKLMVANAAVNQGAALILTSLGRAREAGIPEDRLVYVWAGAGAKEPDDFLRRDRYDRSASMEIVLRRTLDLNRVETSSLDHVELYSCFPCIPKMARRIIGWPEDSPMSVVGGLTFAGGPIANYMSHAIAGMVRKLRTGSRLGLLFGNGGYATKSHALILSREHPPAYALNRDYDVQAEADAQRGPIPVLIENYAGPGRIETYTVPYDRDGAPRYGAIIGRTPSDERFVARVPPEDGETIRFLTGGTEEPVGSTGNAALGADGLVTWRLA
jgi:acetyl-CoA C-acetyltransferase